MRLDGRRSSLMTDGRPGVRDAKSAPAARSKADTGPPLKLRQPYCVALLLLKMNAA